MKVSEQIQHFYDLEMQYTKEFCGLFNQANNDVDLADENAIANLESRSNRMRLLESAIATAQRQRITAINAFNAEHAAQIQAQIDTINNTLAERAQFLHSLVHQIEEFEGVRYLLQVIPASYHGGNDTTKTAQLESERARLENQLSQAKQATVSTSGVITAHSPDELLTSLTQLSPFVIGPPIAAVLHWIAEQTPRITERGNVMRSNNWRIRDVQPVFAVQWLNGRFEAGKSSVKIEPLFHTDVDPHVAFAALTQRGATHIGPITPV